MNGDKFVIVYRLEKNLDLSEFKKICANIGKPKQFYSLARYSEQMGKQVIIGFDNPQDKKYFANLFRIVFPDFIIQEMSKVIKLFCMSMDANDSDLDWKDFFMRKFKETQTVFLTTGQEILATDYRLSKHPLMQQFMPLKTVVVEYSSPGYAFEAYLLLNEASLAHENSMNLHLFVMFEADAEQKSMAMEKKEQQKVEDDAEKSEKHIDNYLGKQMAMMMSPEHIKEQGLDKANSQVKSHVFFKILSDGIKKV